jgi:hypothetical protein
MNLRIGVLIIGSLFWDEAKVRKEWRKSQLEVEKACTATAPIRYGRCSSTWGNTFTMVFSRNCKPGTAKAVPCKGSVSCVEDLIKEAEALWGAEQPAKRFDRKISAPLGCVALLVPSNFDNPEILKGWAKRVSEEKGYGNVGQTKEEGTLVYPCGLLNIPWPVLSGCDPPVQFDAFLATATDPNLEGMPLDYPGPRTIADAWGEDADDNVRYFRNNRKNFICTFQDTEILDILKKDYPKKAEGVA